MSTWKSLAAVGVLALSGAALAPTLVAPGGTPVPPAVDPVPVVDPVPEPVVSAPEGTEIRLELDRDVVGTGRLEERFVSLEITAPVVETAERRPLDLVVVIDNSGSMSGDKMRAARQAAHHLVDALERTDRFSLVVFDSTPDLVFGGASGSDRERLHAAIDRVDDEGGTNLYAGLDMGLNQAAPGDRISRMIVLSDGQTNEGITDPHQIAALAGTAFQRGISVSTVGLGLDFNEDLMFRVAKSGGGSFDFVDDPTQLAGVFRDEVSRTTALAGRRAVIDLELAPGVSGVQLLGWGAERVGNGWRVSLGDLPSGATRRVVARVTMAAGEAGSMPVAEAHVRWLDAAGEAVTAHASLRAEVSASLAKADASVNERVEGEANWMYGNALSRLSAAAYARGDKAEADKAIAQSHAALRTSASRGFAKAADRLAEVAEQQEVQRTHAPSSRKGKRNAKRSLELTALGYVE
jgi:Ca-activated chloride channel family protein